MLRCVVVVALVLALLGVLGAESASNPALHQLVEHTRVLAASSPNTVVCGGAASTYCN